MLSAAAKKSRSCEQNRQKSNKFEMAAVAILNSIYRS